MIKLKIDNKPIEVADGTPIILAAKQVGIEIPAMCWREGKKHITSCMICLVKDASNNKLIPSCSVMVKEGMEIISMDDEILEARKTALDLLLSEHVGDCEAPCQVTCPAHMDIPLMNRLLAKGDFENALKVVRRDIALPSVFGRICPAPCEGACRRKSIDEAVSICLLKRSAGDYDLNKEIPFLPERKHSLGKRIGIIGAGPAGLSAAYFLQIRGYEVEVFDRHENPGGSLRNEVKSGVLPQEVLDKEVEIIRLMGVQFTMKTEVDAKIFKQLQPDYNAIVITTGMGNSGTKTWGLEMTEKGILADPQTYQVGNTNIFVSGSALRPAKMAIKALGQGKELAFSVDQFLQNKEVTGEYFEFNSRFGKLHKVELAEYLKESVKGPRLKPAHEHEGLSVSEVITEAARCLHCDCRDIENCRLRIYSDLYKADQSRFRSEERKLVRKFFQHDAVVYEPTKCIKCGICVDITAEYKEEFGLTFIGKGFEVEIGIPFSQNLSEGLKKVAVMAAKACPTGALSEKEK
jgi:ferredoxin